MRIHQIPPASAHRRIAIVHNADAVEETGDEDAEPPSHAANAEVVETAHCVSGALTEAGFSTFIVPVVDSLSGLVERLRGEGTDLVFNLVESLGGDASREAEVPRLLDAAGIPYTGNGAGACRVANAKDLTRRLLELHEVPCPRGFAVADPNDVPDPIALGLCFPLFVKPARTDASIGIDQGSVVHDQDALCTRIAWLARGNFAGPYVVEEYLPGREINVAIFPDPFTGQLVPTEIDFSGYPADFAPIVTYNCKWVPGSPEYVARSLPAASRLTPAELRQVMWVARAAFMAIGGNSYGRVDLRFDAQGRPRVIDVNPNCDVHPEAGMAVAAQSVGLDYPAFISRLAMGASHKARHVLAPSSVSRPRAISPSAAAY